jgi:hypothetical protein
MALSNCNKDVVTNLFQMLNNNHVNNNKLVETVKTDFSTSAQLALISEQMNLLKTQAANILEKHMLTNEANNAKCTFKKHPEITTTWMLLPF